MKRFGLYLAFVTFLLPATAWATCTNTVAALDGGGTSRTFCRGTDGGSSYVSYFNPVDQGGVNPLFPTAAALSDALGNPTTTLVGAAMLGWDATNSVLRRVQVGPATGSIEITDPLNATGHPDFVTGTGTAGTAAVNPITVQGIAGGVAVPVSAAALPLPALAATSTKQSDGSQKTQLVDGSGNVIASTSNNLDVQCANCSGSGVSTTDEATMTPGTSLFAGGGGFFQTTATSNALTTGKQGMFQVTAQRALFANLRDSSGNEEGLSGQPLQVSVANTGANGTAMLVTGTGGTFPVTGTFWQATQPVSGTFWQTTQPVSIATAPVLVAGSAIIGKVGIDQTTPGTTNGVQVNAALPTGANTVGKVDILGNGAATLDVAQGGATAATNALQIGGVYNSSLPTLTTGQGGAAQLDSSSRILISPSTLTVGSGSTTSGQTGSLVMGAVTTGAPSYTTAQTDPLSLDLAGNLRVNCITGCSSSGGSSVTDEGAFTAGTTALTLGGGFYQTTATSNALTTGQGGSFQVTANRALFSNLRNAAGTEIGTAATPVQVSLANTAANGTAVAVSLAANQSVNTAQVNGVTVLTGAGATGTGSQRNTVAQDTTTIAGSAPGTAGTASSNVVTVQGVASMTKLLVTPDSVALPANQSVNTSQVNAVTVLTGAGATGTGSQRNTVAQDTTTIAGSAPGTAGTASANVVTIQGVASMTPLLANPGTAANWGVGATGSGVPANGSYTGVNTGNNLVGLHACGSYAYKHITTATDTQLVAVSGSTTIYICDIVYSAAAAQNFYLEKSTSSTCGTLTQIDILHTLVANETKDHTAQFYNGLNTGASASLCANTSAAAGIDIGVYYDQY